MRRNETSHHRVLCWLATVLLVSGCATASLEDLRETTPTGSPFKQALAKYYLSFAESEAQQYDWADVRHFADKGLLVAYGGDVSPEDPAQWDIPKNMLPELVAGYEKLMAALAPENRSAHPELSAHAQFLYDCWVEQQEENWQEDDIASCRDGFYRIIARLGGESAGGEEPVTPLASSSAYIVFFEWNSAQLTPTARQVIDGVVADVRDIPKYEIILNSHADRSGSSEYNMELSQKRALAVKRRLERGGIAAADISFYAFGESDTRIDTADGKREKSNRRVEIYINQ